MEALLEGPYFSALAQYRGIASPRLATIRREPLWPLRSLPEDELETLIIQLIAAERLPPPEEEEIHYLILLPEEARPSEAWVAAQYASMYWDARPPYAHELSFSWLSVGQTGADLLGSISGLLVSVLANPHGDGIEVPLDRSSRQEDSPAPYWSASDAAFVVPRSFPPGGALMRSRRLGPILGAPAAATLGKESHLCWTGPGERVLEVIGAGSPRELRAVSPHAPAIAADGQQLVVAWTGPDGQIALGVLGPQGLTQSQPSPALRSSLGPALAFAHGAYFLAWIGPSGNLCVARSKTLRSWLQVASYGLLRSNAPPLLSGAGARLYLSWSDAATKRLAIATLDADALLREVVLFADRSSGAASLAMHGGVLYCAFADPQNHLCLARSTSGVRALAHATDTYRISYDSPRLFVDPADGLQIAWADSRAPRLCVATVALPGDVARDHSSGREIASQARGRSRAGCGIVAP